MCMHWRMGSLFNTRRGSAWRLALAGTAFAVMAGGCSLLPKEEESLAPPLVKPSEDSVQTAEAKRGDIVKYVRGVGAFESTKIVYHALKEPGAIVEEMKAKAGDVVKRGDVLIQFQVGDLDLAVQEQQLSVMYAERSYREALASGDDEMIEIRRLELNIARTRLEKTQTRLDSLQLKAEADGVVVYAEKLERNQRVDDGRTLVSVADPSELRIAYEASNRSALAGVKPGMPVEIEYDGAALAGTVAQTPDSAPATLNPQLSDMYSRTLYITLDAIPEGAAMGELADIRIATERSEDTVIIPRGALRSYFGRTYVQVIEGESRKEFDVEKGVETSTEVEIVKGLEEGAVVILQ